MKPPLHAALLVLACALGLGVACSKQPSDNAPTASQPAADTPKPAPSPPPAASGTPAEAAKPAHHTPPAPAVEPRVAPEGPYVRRGPLAGARRIADHLSSLKPGETALKITLHAGDAWEVTHPADGAELPELPEMVRLPWLHVEVPDGHLLVPFSALKTATLAPHGQLKDRALAQIVLQDGSEVRGTVRGHLGGTIEFGRIEVEWRSIKSIEMGRSAQAGPADALPLAARTVATMQHGGTWEFTSWGAVVGDVVTDVLLAESGTGPEMLPLPKAGSVEFIGRDLRAFIFQQAVALGETRRYVALTTVVLQQSNGCLLFLSPGVIQSLTWQ